MEVSSSLIKANGSVSSGGITEAPVSTPVAPRRYLDPHTFRHTKFPKAALAIAGAEVLDGRVQLLNPTLEMIALAVGVSPSYVAAARKLTLEQREDVLRGKRPFVQPKLPSPAFSVQQRFADLVTELGGFASALDELAKLERNAGNGRAVT